MIMAKVLGICGSPRKKSSYLALSAALDAAEAKGAEIELVELRARKMNPCIHCNKCLRDKSDRCTVFKDDLTELYDRFYTTDGIIVASPVYEMNITAQLAIFFSRFRSAWMLSVDNPWFFTRKVGGAIAVGGTRNGGQENTIQSIHNFYHTQGLLICGGGSGIYSGASLWNPGDGSGKMDDETGLNNARALGGKIAVLAEDLRRARVKK